MKQFDWVFCAKEHGPEMVAFMQGVHDKEITEDAFVAAFQKVPREGNKAKRGRRSPSAGRYMYRNLRDKFGFFYGTKDV